MGGSSGQVRGTNLGATKEAQELDIEDTLGGKSIWWSWVAPEAGRVTFQTLTSGIDTLLGVYTGDALGSLQVAAENDDISEDELTSAVTFPAQQGTAYQIAVDGYEADSGIVVLTWYLESASFSGPPNDDFGSRAQITGASGEVITTNNRGSKEPQEPDHAEKPGGRSIWWSWAPPSDGTATFSTLGSNFDTVLAVYTGDIVGSLRGVTADNDGGEGSSSRVDFKVTAGVEYQIAVDGVGAETGMAVLKWSLALPCKGPREPENPGPAADAAGLPTSINLSWNRALELRRKVIYGADDRRDVYEVKDPAILEAWDSTVALVSVADVTDNGDGTFSLPSAPLSASLALCPSERFRDQPSPAFCSGFLVGPDLVATAGHCVPSLLDCNHTAMVFGFRMLDPDKPVLTFPRSQLYFCQGIVGTFTASEDEDWGIVRLDREVPDHKPLPIRRAGKIANSQPLLVIGHPLGLPAKIAGGAAVRDNSAADFFLANLDTYGGNSGSAVFNANTLTVEGILIAGEEDFVQEGDCLRSKQCFDADCSGEAVTRPTQFVHLVPPLSDSVQYEVYLGACGSLTLLGTTSETSWQAENLDRGVKYCWQIVARSDCGSSPGPVWSFTTASVEKPFRRGDVRVDDLINITDPIATLNFLFLGGEAPPCLKSADADDDGVLVLTDAVYLLRFLFLAGPAPLPPSACGTDPTADTLSCDAAGCQ